MKEEQQKRDTGLEAAGSLTPALSGGGHSHAHPFRYAGQEPNGRPQSQAQPPQEE